MKNNFLISPLKIHFIDFFEKKTKILYFIGKVPINILTELKKKPSKSKILTNFYKKWSNIFNFDKECIFSTISIFDDDNMIDIKNKIYIETNINPLRMHLFTTNNKLFEFKNIKSKESNEFMFGLPIDLNIYEDYNLVKVISYDQFTKINDFIEDTKDIYCVDLFNIISNISSELINFINDESIILKFYYGFIYKFFPWITKQIFINLLDNINSLDENYPPIDKTKIEKIYEKQENILLDVYKNKNNYIDTVSITQFLSINEMKNTINFRILFDILQTSKDIPIIKLCLHNGIFTKKHFGFDNIKIKTDIIGMYIFINMNYEDINRYIILILSNWGIGILCKWKLDEFIDFDYVFKLIELKINPIILHLNSIKNLIFNTNDLYLLDANNINLKKIDIVLISNQTFDENRSIGLKDMIKQYEQADLLNIKRESVIYFKKGLVNYNTSLINKSYPNLINNYEYLTNPNIKDKWDLIYAGKKIEIEYNYYNIRFHLFKINDNDLLTLIKYINSIIHSIIKYKQIKIENKEVKKLKKLYMQDPNLFKIKKYGSKKVYSVLCQESKQPIIYSENEVKKLKKKINLVKFHNFTYNKSSYYFCDNPIYKYLGFIVNKHPLNYCIPCCKKKKIKNTKTKVISEHCIKNFTYSKKDTEKKEYIMSYEKNIESGRLAYLPKYLENLHDNLYIYGVPQFNKIGFFYSLINALDMTIEDFVKDLIKKMQKFDFSYYDNGNLKNTYGTLKNFYINFKDLLFNNISIDTIFYDNFYKFMEDICIKFYNIYICLCDINNIFFYQNIYNKNKIVLFFVNETNYYPIYKINIVDFNKLNLIEQKIFSFDIISPYINTTILNLNYASTIGKIKIIFVDFSNVCYGVLIELEKLNVFLPIDFIQVENGLFENYNPKKYNVSIDNIDKLIEKLGENIIIDKIIKYIDNFIGYKLFIFNRKYNIYFTDTKINKHNYEIEEIMYNPLEVNEKIIKNIIDEDLMLHKYVTYGYYENYLYNLLLLHFINYINNHKNKKIRNHIKNNYRNKEDLFKNINISPKDMNSINNLKDNTNEKFIEYFDRTSFNFDGLILSELKNSESKLDKIFNEIAIPGEIDIKKFENTLLICNNKIDYCLDNKLIIPKRKFTKYKQLLYNDINDPLKSSFLNYNVKNIINYFLNKK